MPKHLLIALLCVMYVALEAKNKTSFVDLFIGTSGDFGQLDPAATIPFCQIKVGPDTQPRNHSGYNFDNTLLSGFSINRVTGVGCSGAGGNLSILPITVDSNAQKVHIKKNTEQASPGYYTTKLSNGVKAEMTASRAVAIERFTFPKNAQRKLLLNLTASFAKFDKAVYRIDNTNEITGYVSAANVCDEGKYTIYFHLKSNVSFLISEVQKGKLLLEYPKSGKPVEIRLAISSVDAETAKSENNILTQSFDEVRRTANDIWNIKLDKIDIAASEKDKIMFYSMLYRQFMSPVDITSFDGRYRGADGKIYTTNGNRFYSSWSLWDTYRTKFPLLAIIEPDLMSDFANSLIGLYLQGKKNWSTKSESTPTVRTEHAVIVLLDAVEKGIKNVKLRDAYQKMKIEAENLPVKTPDNKLESAYDLWALSKIAGRLVYPEDSIKYKQKSDEIWTKVWIEKFKTIKPETFDIMHGDGLYEGTLWQYRWAVPFDIEKMAELADGKNNLKKELSYFFENSLYNHGNQPDIHAAFIFNRLNDNASTNKWVNRILRGGMSHLYGTHQKNKNPYTECTYKPQKRAFIPEMDDDDGTMSAWYIFASCGFYPLVVGSPKYELCRPIFKKIKFNMPNDKTFTIINNKPKSIDASYYLSNKPVANHQIEHQSIIQGEILNIK